jgi:hypothetical protein
MWISVAENPGSREGDCINGNALKVVPDQAAKQASGAVPPPLTFL